MSLDVIKDLKISFKSKSGSTYITTNIGIYRISNHWGRVANCRWRLDALSDYKNQNTAVGFAKWSDFYPINETSKLYFIKVNFEDNTAEFFHKNSIDYYGKATLRTSSETTKIIKIIKTMLNETSWSKYYEFENYQQLQRELISELIYTEKTFIEIRRKFLL